SDLPEASRQGDGRPTAVVVFHRDVRPSGGVFYFRQAAFSQFNGSRLVTTSRLNVDPGTRVDFPYERRVVDSPPADPMGRTDIALDIAWLTPHPRLFALSDPVEVAPRANPDPGRFVRAYSVVSRVLTADYEMFIDAPAGDPDWDDEVWQAYTELPRDERYHRLAASLQSRLRDKFNQSPLALALTVKQYLEETTTYSFARRYEGDEPTAEFLFSEDRKGYCVHLAHAAAYLMRALGLPTRVSSGYAVEATNMGGGSSLLIKSADAHAWAELYLRGVGWIPIEVTPEKTDVKPKPFEEQDLQQLLGEMARREAPTDRTPPSGVRIMDFFKMAWAAVPWVLLALLMLAYAVKIWRYAAPFVDRRRPKLAYRAALDRLSAVGWTRGHGEPRERFAARLKTEVPSLAPLTAGLSGYVFGSVEPPENLAGAPLHALAQSVGHEVRQAVPTWRWLMGVLNPVSWWWSR
ncbi:MAG: transglutaminase-like domain-containing protein, partial [Myxococcota bacterium]